MAQVTNRFQALQYLKKLPSDFMAVKVDFQSLKDSSLRKLCRDLEKQLKLQQVNLNYEKDLYDEYLKKILDDERFDTTEIEKSLVVLGNKHGFLSGKIFNQADFSKQVIDITQFDDNYPIFIDTSTSRFLETGKTTEQVKREREQTFSYDPEPKQSRIETIEDLQAAWADQEDEYKQQIENFKQQYEAEQEHNRMIVKSAAENEQYFTNTVNELKQKVQQLEVSRYHESIANEEMGQLREINEQLKTRIEEITEQNNEDRQKVMGLFDGMADSEPMQEEMQEENLDATQKALAEQLTQTKTVIEDQLSKKTTLSQFGITSWNPKTTSFLDYLITFRCAVITDKMTAPKAVQLLFSSLPSEYGHLRAIVSTHPDYKKNNKPGTEDYSNHYLDVERILVRVIVGGQEKIFSEFLKLQRKPDDDFLRYFQKVCDFYLFACEDYSEYSISSTTVLDKDAMAFKMIKEKMCSALPNRYVPEFKRRLEEKTKISEMYLALLDLRDQFPEIEETVYSGTNLHVLKQKNADWKKKAKCFRCGRTGHIKRECFAREPKTKKSGIRNERK